MNRKYYVVASGWMGFDSDTIRNGHAPWGVWCATYEEAIREVNRKMNEKNLSDIVYLYDVDADRIYNSNYSINFDYNNHRYEVAR